MFLCKRLDSIQRNSCFRGRFLPTFIVRMLEVMCDALLYSAWRFIHSRKCEARPSSTRYLRELVAGVSGEEGTHIKTQKRFSQENHAKDPTSSPTTSLLSFLCVYSHFITFVVLRLILHPLFSFSSQLSNNKTISSSSSSSSHKSFLKEKKKTLYVLSARMSDGGGVIMVRT